MANNFQDGTGLLYLEKRTPIIDALFGAYKLRTYEDRQDVLAFSTEDEESDWDDVLARLIELAGNIGCVLTDEQSEDIGSVVAALGKFKGSVFTKVHGAILHDMILAREPYDDSPCLESLFALAHYLDDGHGLKAVEEETAYTCDKMRVGSFGGSFNYTSIAYQLCIGTQTACMRSRQVAEAISKGDEDALASAVLPFALDGLHFTDPEMRQRIKLKVAKLLASHPN